MTWHAVSALCLPVSEGPAGTIVPRSPWPDRLGGDAASHAGVCAEAMSRRRERPRRPVRFSGPADRLADRRHDLLREAGHRHWCGGVVRAAVDEATRPVLEYRSRHLLDPLAR